MNQIKYFKQFHSRSFQLHRTIKRNPKQLSWPNSKIIQRPNIVIQRNQNYFIQEPSRSSFKFIHDTSSHAKRKFSFKEYYIEGTLKIAF